MTQRPESVSVVSWLVIVFCGVGLLGGLMAWSLRDWPAMQPMLAQYRVPYPVVMMISALGVSIHLLCAVAWLWRLGWARHVYMVVAAATVGFSLWVMPWPLFVLPSLAYYAVVAVFLYRPVANRWFAGEDAAAGVAG